MKCWAAPECNAYYALHAGAAHYLEIYFFHMIFIKQDKKTHFFYFAVFYACLSRSFTSFNTPLVRRRQCTLLHYRRAASGQMSLTQTQMI